MSGIYIHIPFCKQACHYCDFHFSTSLKKKGEMILALAKEITLRKEEFLNEKIATIYFGGGTPSLGRPEMFSKLLEGIYEKFDTVAWDGRPLEVSMEVNPTLANESTLKNLKDGGEHFCIFFSLITMFFDSLNSSILATWRNPSSILIIPP